MGDERQTIIFLVKFIPAPAFDGGALRDKAWLKFFLKKYNVILIGFFNKRYHSRMVSDLSHPRLAIYGYNFRKNIFRKFFTLVKLILFKRSLILGRYVDRRITRKIDELIHEQNISFIFSSELATMENINIHAISKIPIYFDDHNVEFNLLDRMIEYEKWPRKFFLGMEQKKVKKYEVEALKKSAGNFCVSNIDKKMLLEASGLDNKKIKVINNVFLTTEEYVSKNIKDEPIIVFIGNLSWMPNKYGLIRFFENVFSKVVKKINNVNFYIIGSNMPKEIKKYSKNLPVKFFTDILEEEKNKILDRCWLGVVPLYFASGSRIKILELWSHKMAVVSTIIGAEGLELSHGNHIISSDDNFAKKIIELLSDGDQLLSDGLCNYEVFIKNYSFDIVYENSLYNSFPSK